LAATGVEINSAPSPVHIKDPISPQLPSTPRTLLKPTSLLSLPPDSPQAATVVQRVEKKQSGKKRMAKNDYLKEDVTVQETVTRSGRVSRKVTSLEPTIAIAVSSSVYFYHYHVFNFLQIVV